MSPWARCTGDLIKDLLSITSPSQSNTCTNTLIHTEDSTCAWCEEHWSHFQVGFPYWEAFGFKEFFLNKKKNMLWGKAHKLGHSFLQTKPSLPLNKTNFERLWPKHLSQFKYNRHHDLRTLAKVLVQVLLQTCTIKPSSLWTSKVTSLQNFWLLMIYGFT